MVPARPPPPPPRRYSPVQANHIQLTVALEVDVELGLHLVVTHGVAIALASLLSCSSTHRTKSHQVSPIPLD